MKQTGRYILILVAVMVLWNSFVIWPLKIFTVVLHELGHALMAVIFRHGIQGIEVYFNESGHTIVKSGGWLSDFFITNGGYLGSLVFALIILRLKNTPLKKFILGGTAIIFLAVSIKYSKFMSSLFIFSIGFAAVVIILYMLQKEAINDWVIDIIGIASVAYAVYDTFVDTIMLRLNTMLHLFRYTGRQPVTDAVRLEQLTHIPSIVWGLFWLFMSFLLIYFCLIRSGSKTKKTSRG